MGEPLPLVLPDAEDYNSYSHNNFVGLIMTNLAEEEDLDTPISRVFVLFKILLVNLVFGCVCTVICLSVKRSVGRLLSVLLCGFCDDCDCDYDGSHASRSRQVLVERRKGRKAREGANSQTVWYEDTVAYTAWLICKNLFKNKKLAKRISSLVIGILFAGYLLMPVQFFPRAEDDVPTLIHSFSDRRIFTAKTDSPKRVFVVTPSLASGIQNARLVRMAQALFPSREFVTWIIVSSDPSPLSLWYLRQKTEHWEEKQMQVWARNESRVFAHLDDLHATVSRLGIPFVILSGHAIHHKDAGFTKGQLNGRQSLSTFMKASQVGISWVAKTFQSGVLFVGPDDTVYNFKLFREVQGTKLMSSWPTAFDPRYRFGLSTPLLDTGKMKIQGYFVGGVDKPSQVPLQYASFALNIKLVEELRSANELWKLTFDNVYSSKDLDLKTYHVQALAGNCTEIYVWKIISTRTHLASINKQEIPLKIKWLNTNVRTLLDLINRWYALDIFQ